MRFVWGWTEQVFQEFRQHLDYYQRVKYSRVAADRFPGPKGVYVLR